MMDKLAVKHMLIIANDEDYIVIDFTNKQSISAKKKAIYYHFFGNYLRLSDKNKKREYMLDIDYIQGITIQHPRFKGMTWYNQGENKTKMKME